MKMSLKPTGKELGRAGNGLGVPDAMDLLHTLVVLNANTDDRPSNRPVRVWWFRKLRFEKDVVGGGAREREKGKSCRGPTLYPIAANETSTCLFGPVCPPPQFAFILRTITPFHTDKIL